MSNRIHVRDLPACEQDIIVNMDDEKDLKAIDNGRGVHIARVIVWKNGKRQVGWVSIGCYRGKAILQITVGKKNRTETRKNITMRPWLPKDDVADSDNSPE